MFHLQMPENRLTWHTFLKAAASITVTIAYDFETINKQLNSSEK